MVTKEESPIAVVAKENLHQKLSPNPTVPTSQTDSEVNTTIVPVNTSITPVNTSNVPEKPSQTDREVNTTIVPVNTSITPVNTSIVPEKPSEDGYNWRKYGQKNVKGNEYIRSYYKCSYPNCHVKKQVERSQDGRITDVTYLGNHDHDKPHTEPEVAGPSLLSAQVQIPACPPAVQEEKPANVPALATNNVQPMNVCNSLAVATAETVSALGTPSSKRRDDHAENFTPKKRKVDAADITPEKPGYESRLVVQTVSEVDIVNDGYRWRKYGQKMVKGNPNPRSYYRCSTAGCPVKKHVERASYDPKVVITTYENQHDHSMPPVRTIVPQSAAPSSGGMDSNGVDKSKSEESDTAQTTPINCETDKAVTVNPAAKEKDNLAVKAQNEELSSHQELSNKAKNGDHTDQMAKEETGVEVNVETKHDITKSERQLQDPSCTASVDVKPEPLPTEQKRADAVLGSSHAKTASNGQQRTDAEPVNC